MRQVGSVTSAFCIGAFLCLGAVACGDDQARVADGAADADATDATREVDGATLLDADVIGDASDGAADASDGTAVDVADADDSVSPSDGRDSEPGDSGLDGIDDVPPADVPQADGAEVDGTEVCTFPGALGSRRVTPAGGVVVFEELAFGDGDPAKAWLELHNQQAIDADISGWRLAGAVQYTFAEGTFIAPGSQLVVAAAPGSLTVPALGPWTGGLAPGGELRLYNNAGRLMDSMAWTGRAPWPTSGAGMVKRDPDLASGLGESWAASAFATPGTLATPASGNAVLIADDAPWRHSAGLAAGWADSGFDDASWDEGVAPFASGTPGPVDAVATFTADNAFALYLGQADGSGMRYIGRDADGGWQSSEAFAITAQPGEHLFVAGWEGPGDSGSPQMIIGEVTRAADQSVLLATAADAFDAVLGPVDANPGGGLGDAAPSAEAVSAVASDVDAFTVPAAERSGTSDPWAGQLSGDLGDARFLWIDTFDANSITNSSNTYALFRSRTPIAKPAGTELAPARTAYFRTAFEVASDPAATRFSFTLEAADGVVVYLNGHEILRDNVPAGDLLATTPALAPASLELAGNLPSELVVQGSNVLAVEVHSAATSPRFALQLASHATLREPEPAVDGAIVINELMYNPAGDGSEWIELYNPGPALDIGRWQLADAVSHVFAAGTTIAANGYLVIADDRSAFLRDYPNVPASAVIALNAGGLGNDGEQILLVDACGRTVDAVRYADGGRWPANADGGGSSLVLGDARADNGAPEAWHASDESSRSQWQTITYRAVASPSPVGPDNRWQELVLGLLDAGEVLVDDVSVVVSPNQPGARELVSDGHFDAGLADWHAIGTHRESRVEPDPDDPSNPVLHIVATGSTDHMHNQVVTTLTSAIANGTTYEVSFRARWVAGDVQLNSRLYFNRLARTTRLAAPSGGGTPGARNDSAGNGGPTFAGLAHEPAVPRPNEPVVVSAFARDPDGVAALELWTSVDGGAFAATPMTHVAGERYEATLPGRPFGTLVQFYVAASDRLAATATFPRRGPESRALYQVGDAPPAASARLHPLRILMTPADRARFHAATELMSNADTGCTVIYDDDEIFYDVGVRAKGSERGRPSDARLGFHVSFDPLKPLRGVYDSVSIDRSEGTHTGQREILMDLVMAHAGAVSAEYNDLVYLFAPRSQQTGPALLQTARFGDVMLDNQFEDGSDGRVYEYELVYYPTTTVDGTASGLKLPQPDDVVGYPMRSMGSDPEAYRYTFLVKNNRKDDDFGDLMAFLDVFSEGEAEFATGIADAIDLDEWLRAFVFMAVSGATDHYGMGAQHNVQLYLDPDGRAYLFPHDLDFYGGDALSGLVQNGDLARLLRLEGVQRRFYAQLADVLQNTYNDAYMAHWRDQLGALLPSQPFASHHAYIVQRSDYLMNDAPNAVTKVYPYVPFAVAKPQDGVLEATRGTIQVQGVGWLDVASIVLAADPSQGLGAQTLPLSWFDDSGWIVTLDLPLGLHTVTLEAHDARGAVIDSDTITIAVSAP